MSFSGSGGPRLGDDPSGAWGEEKLRKLTVQADAGRAAREGEYKSPFRRLLDRLRPHREEPGGEPRSS
jgi:hypothetical protein